MSTALVLSIVGICFILGISAGMAVIRQGDRALLEYNERDERREHHMMMERHHALMHMEYEDEGMKRRARKLELAERELDRRKREQDIMFRALTLELRRQGIEWKPVEDVQEAVQAGD